MKSDKKTKNMEEDKIKKYIIFIMPSTLHNISGLDCDATIEEVREFAKKQNGRVAHRVFNSERDCLVYFTALCDSGNVFGENIYYYLFTEPTVEPIDEPMLTWFNLIKEFITSENYEVYESTLVGLRKLIDEQYDDLSESAIEFWNMFYCGTDKIALSEYVAGFLSDLLHKAATNYFLDKYVGYVDPMYLPENSTYLEFMKEKRDYPQLRDK